MERKCKGYTTKFSNLLNDRVWEQYNANDEQTKEFTEKEKELVDDLLRKCIKYDKKNDNIHVAFLFICAYQNGSDGIQFPLIRVIKNSGKNSTNSYFIDHFGRVYDNWFNFLDENIFNQWCICVPKSGIYSDSVEVEIEFYDQTKKGEVIRTIDIISTVFNVVTSITMLRGTIMTFPRVWVDGFETIAQGLSYIAYCNYHITQTLNALSDPTTISHRVQAEAVNKKMTLSWKIDIENIQSFAAICDY
ncbi:unnamed protein product [Rotaria sp. Silwood1]|nr:unnamed protein product [Rotaria sp. Silwood1]